MAGLRSVDDADDGGGSQTVKAQLRLRELIVSGELAPGERVPELSLVERLGVSRTPVRTALQRLRDEGLLEGLAGGGYAVKAFSEADIHDAIEVRGTLEGLAARLAAERGVGTALLAEAHACLDAIDAVLAGPDFSDAAFSAYVEHNGRFHALLAEMAGSALVRQQVERAAALPFASPNGFVMARASGPGARDALVIAQQQHRAVIQAIEQREGARAEALMREHARLARQNLRQALATRHGLAQVPGGSLIRRPGSR
ncbi:MAG: GntR family transcriptional regulator [Rubrivivax sp.]|nr:GntR family transcriptional regulator [Rubrivivax sp.]